MMKDSNELYKVLNNAYDYFNDGLFDGKLPSVILTFRRARRSKGLAAKWLWRSEAATTDEKLHEVSISPYWLMEPLKEVYSTLVHEQCHIWQFEFGKPSDYGYHNWEWAKKMEEVGLTPSHTGKEGGKKIGYSLSHYITVGGKYELLYERIPKKCLLPARSIEGSYTANKDRNKVKYQCLTFGCNYSVWGKPGLSLICGVCKKHLLKD